MQNKGALGLKIFFAAIGFGILSGLAGDWGWEHTAAFDSAKILCLFFMAGLAFRMWQDGGK